MYMEQATDRTELPAKTTFNRTVGGPGTPRKMTSLEVRLLLLVAACTRCRDLGLVVRPAPKFGLEVVRGGQIVGLWSEQESRLGFRNLAAWRTHRTAHTPQEALEITIEMAEQNRWLD